MTKLSLRQTNVHDESIKVLCHSDIEYLDFGRTSLTNQAADYLIKHAKQTKIWVDVTNITPDKIQEINRRTESNKQKSGEELLRATLLEVQLLKQQKGVLRLSVIPLIFLHHLLPQKMSHLIIKYWQSTN